MTDPLQNPRPVWRQHFDHRTLAGRWGMFLARVLRLKWSTWRHWDQLKREVKG